MMFTKILRHSLSQLAQFRLVDEEDIKKATFGQRAEWIVVYKAGSKQCEIKIKAKSSNRGIFFWKRGWNSRTVQ
jgi:hypothetical protein